MPWARFFQDIEGDAVTVDEYVEHYKKPSVWDHHSNFFWQLNSIRSISSFTSRLLLLVTSISQWTLLRKSLRKSHNQVVAQDLLISVWLLGREQKDANHNWDLHTIFPELPSQLYVDKVGSSKSCIFNHCLKEEVTFEQPVVNSSLRAKALLKCKFSAHGSEIETKRLPSPFVWPLRENLIDDGDGSGNESRKYSVRRSDGLASLEIDHLTSDELGYVACKCFECRVPRFAIAELRVDVNVTATIEGNNGSDAELIVHGYPLDNITAQIVRLNDNITETIQLNDHITAFFNNSFLVKYQREHSYFFLKYFSVYIHECVECEHHQPVLSKYFGSDYTKVQGKSSGSFSSKFAYYLLVFLFVLALFTGLAFMSGLASWKIRRKILRHGWEIKRRRASRNTERTEETSVPLDTISHSASSCSYMTQHVPVIDNKYIQLKEKIGKGAFGEVYTAEWIQSDDENAKGEKVAIKMLHNVTLDAEMDKEAALLAKLDHANVLKLYGVCHWHAQITLVLELMNQGDLKSYLKNRMPRCDNYSQFPPALLQTELINICTQIATGLCYIASQQIVHRDLAARNCLVSGESDLKFCSAAFRPPITVKISDFGMSRRLYSDTEYYRMHDKRTALPVRWLPPECLSSGKFTQLSDMWSFGVTLFEVFTYGDVPFGNLSNNEVLSAVVSGLRPEIPINCPLGIGEIMKACWKENPLKRICAEEALTRLKLIQ
uniref:Protein kinase domain-containing protein n=1 Tax=Ditylenchus dipsaci TaxID=166011 RepID=A0A915E4Y0_9BILA